MQQVTRVLTLAERYVSTIEESSSVCRTLVPHASTFKGSRRNITVLMDKKEEVLIKVSLLFKKNIFGV